MNHIVQELKKELEQYKYPYDSRAKLLNGIIYLLEFYEEMKSPAEFNKNSLNISLT